jgi:hypothetical protein
MGRMHGYRFSENCKKQRTRYPLATRLCAAFSGPPTEVGGLPGKNDDLVDPVLTLLTHAHGNQQTLPGRAKGQVSDPFLPGVEAVTLAITRFQDKTFKVTKAIEDHFDDLSC